MNVSNTEKETVKENKQNSPGDRVARREMEALVDGLIILDPGNPDDFWMSASFWRTLGRSESQERTASGWDSLILSEDLPGALNFFRNPAGAFFLRFLKWSGEIVHARLRGSLLEDGSGRAMFSIVDVTEQMRSGQELQNQQNYLAQILRHTGDLFFVLDENYRFIHYFHAPEDRNQLVSPELYMGRSIFEIGFPEHSLDLIAGALEKSRQTGSRSHAEYSLDLGSGTRWFNLAVSRSRGRKETEYICVVTDITQKVNMLNRLRENAQRFQLFFKNSMAGFFFMMLDEPVVWNAQTNKEAALDYVFSHQRITEVNQAMLDQYGATEEAFLGLTPADFFAHDLLHGRQIWREFFDTGRALLVTDERRMDGSQMWIEGDYICMYDDMGRIVGHFGVQRDITARKLAEEKLEEAREASAMANRTRAEFLAHISHELRTPLNGIIGFSDLLSRASLSGPARQYAELNNQSARILMELVNNVLDYSRLDAGRMELRIEEAELSTIARQAADAVLYEADQKGLELLIDLVPGLPSRVMADSARLKQILINLLGNAVKFTGRGEIELRMECLERGKIRFAVRDSGPGIQEEDRGRIFEAFSRGSGGALQGGSGLGLAIASQLVELMGGKLSLLDDHRGALFFFDLDLEVAEEEQQVPFDSKFQKALVLHGNRRAALHISGILRSLGLRSQEALSLEELHSRITHQSYDLILLDEDLYTPLLADFLSEATSMPAQILALTRMHESGPSLPDRVAEIPLLPIRRALDAQLLADVLQRKRSEAAGAGGSGAVSLPGGRPFTVLVAEDNPINMTLNRHLLTSLAPHAEVLEAQNGAEALKLFSEGRPDIVFLDLNMPVLDGFQVARQIRKWNTGRNTPIIALTAATMEEEREKTLAAGMNDFIAKPLERKALAGALRHWLADASKTPEDPFMIARQRLAEFTDLPAGEIASLLSRAHDSLLSDHRTLMNYVDLQDADKIADLLHTMKGTAKAIYRQDLVNVIVDLETLSRTGTLNRQHLEPLRRIIEP
ncbi:MAG: response regulator [Leptospiraceae bacterium]|nr:response regulator [Leptospiraceae bacterium]